MSDKRILGSWFLRIRITGSWFSRDDQTMVVQVVGFNSVLRDLDFEVFRMLGFKAFRMFGFSLVFLRFLDSGFSSVIGF